MITQHLARKRNFQMYTIDLQFFYGKPFLEK